MQSFAAMQCRTRRGSRVNAVNTLLMGVAAAFFAFLAFRLSSKLTKTERENEVLWEQTQRYEAYIASRAAEDEERQRTAIMN